MAKFKVKRRGGNLVVDARLKSFEQISGREAEFVSANFTHGVFKVRALSSNRIEFTAPDGVNLISYLANSQGSHIFYLIIMQIVFMIKRITEVGLSADRLVFDAGYVFVNNITGELWCIYFPVVNPQAGWNVFSFLYSLCYSVTPGANTDPGYLFNFADFLVRQGAFNCKSIMEYIRAQDPAAVSEAEGINRDGSGFITCRQADYYDHYANRQQVRGPGAVSEQGNVSPYPQAGFQAGGFDEEETTLLVDDCEETTLLTEETGSAFRYPSVTRMKTGENVSINKPVFRIGKERSFVDYFVADNSAVSRSHADIICRNGGYYIKDLNSKNGSYVNERRLNPDFEMEIHDGDALRLADENFIFRL